MNHLQEYLVEEFIEDYQEGQISRRQALKLIAGITGTSAAAALLAACGTPAQPASAPTSAATSAPAATAMPAATSAPAATTAAAATAAPAATAAATPPSAPAGVNIAPDDPAIKAEMVQFAGPDAQLMGYLAHPSADGNYPVVLVCHENRGLTPYVQDVARRLAKVGYVGLAVDLLSREGGTAKVADQNAIPGLLSAAPPARHVQDFQAGLAYLKTQAFAQTAKSGMIGFCFGGGVTWLVAAGIPELKAAVPFYGPPPPADQFAKINAAVLAVYAEKDQRITGTLTVSEQAMKAAGKTFEPKIYPGVDHAFHNDTGARYNPEQAQAAWNDALSWFDTYVKA